jgi:hypothetical protein
LIGHFSAEDLASYRAGAIDADRAARISAHLADCARCAGVDDDLAGVSTLLASMPVPPMPDRLTERVSAAIAAESRQRAAGLNAARAGQAAAGSVNAGVAADGDRAGIPAGPVSVPGRPDLPDRSRRRRAGSRRSVWTSPLVVGGLAVTGVFAVIVIGAAFALTHLPALGPASAPRSAARGQAPQAAPAPGSYGGANRPVGAPSGLSVHYHEAGRKRNTLAFATTVNYTHGNIGRGVRSAVSNSALFTTLAPAGGPASPTTQNPSPVSTQPTSTPPKATLKVGSVSVGQIAGCLSAVAVSNGVLIVEVAHYQGKPAMIIVGRPAAGSYRVIVAGLACSASHPDVLARITVPRAR